MKAKSPRNKPLKISLKFDEAICRTVQVKPPREGWTKYVKKLMREQKRQRPKSTA